MEFMRGFICKSFTGDMSNHPVLATIRCSKDFAKEEVALSQERLEGSFKFKMRCNKT